MNKRFFALRFYLLWLLLCFPVVSYTIELEVVTEDVRPYNYLENGKIKGTATIIVKQVLQRAGIAYSLTLYPWARAYNIALEKENVLLYTVARTPARERQFKWVRPLGRSNKTSLYRLKKNHAINPKTLDEAKQYSIGSNIHSMDHHWLKHNGFTQLESLPTQQHNIKMFFAERYDLIAIVDSVVEAEFRKAGFDYTQAVYVMSLFDTFPYMALSLSTSDDIVERLKVAYDELMDENKINLQH